MHAESYNFVVRALTQATITGTRVLELGSYDVNGEIRPAFRGADLYVGTDARPGPGVDIVAEAKNVDGGRSYDIVVSTSLLEHMRLPHEAVDAAARCLKPGGLFICTTVTSPFPKHSAFGGPELLEGEFYGDIEPEVLSLLLWPDRWREVRVERDNHGNVFATAVRL